MILAAVDQLRCSATWHRDRRRSSSYCDIWNPEDREIDDLQFLKDLDKRLFDRGRPHIMDLFELDYLTENLLRGGLSDPLDPLQILSRLRRLYRPSSTGTP